MLLQNFVRKQRLSANKYLIQQTMVLTLASPTSSGPAVEQFLVSESGAAAMSSDCPAARTGSA